MLTCGAYPSFVIKLQPFKDLQEFTSPAVKSAVQYVLTPFSYRRVSRKKFRVYFHPLLHAVINSIFLHLRKTHSSSSACKIDMATSLKEIVHMKSMLPAKARPDQATDSIDMPCTIRGRGVSFNFRPAPRYSVRRYLLVPYWWSPSLPNVGGGGR